MSVTALIVAAGSGSRMGGATPKQFRALGGKPVLRWAVEPFLHHSAVQRRACSRRRRTGAARRRCVAWARCRGLDHRRRRAIGLGPGRTCEAIAGDAVLIHDAARPFCPAAVIDRLVASLEFYRRRCAGPAGRRHASPSRRKPRRDDRPFRPGPRPNAAGISSRSACGTLIEDWRAPLRPTKRPSFAPPGWRSPRSRAIRRSTN